MPPTSPASTPSPWACPVCQLPLTQEARLWKCDSNHCFDLAKEGYANLLLANQKHSAEPGDTHAMMINRRAFLAAGHYRPLVQALDRWFAEHLKKNASLLDSGCGEAYYLQQLAECRSDLALYGLDISRAAIKLASRGSCAAEFAVASAFQLPLLNQSLDAVLRVFAPGDAAEVARVLKPGGVFAVVAPGPRHLYGLKTRLYDEAREHDQPTAPEGFDLVDQDRVTYSLTLSGAEAVTQLLAMTPFYWRAAPAAKAQVDRLDALETEVDFDLRLYKPQPRKLWRSDP